MGPWEKFAPKQKAKPWEKFAPVQEVAQEGPKESLYRTVFDQGMQGGTFGFADEASDALGALGAGILSPDLTIKDAYMQARQLTKERQTRQFQQRPGASIAANLTGGLLTGAAGATTKAGAAIGNSLRTGSTTARAVKSAVAGSASGGLYGAGTGEDGKRLQSAGQGAILGGVVGAAVPAISAAVSKLNTKTVIPNSEQIREKGSQFFKLADESGGILRSEVADDFYNKVLNIRPQTEAGRVFKGSSPVTNVLDEIPSLKGKPLTLQGAKEVDEALGDLAYSTMDKFGKLTSDGKKFLDMQTALRRTIDSADESMISGGKEGFEALKEARKYWSTSLRLRDIERIIDNAQRMEQPATAIKSGFRALLKNGDRLKGYSPAEVKAIQRASETGLVTDLFRLAGSGLVPIGTSIAGTAAGGPVGGLISGAVGYGLQQGSKAIGVSRQTSRANNAARAIAERSGMVTEQKRLQLPPEIMKKIMAMPPKAARALMDQLQNQP